MAKATSSPGKLRLTLLFGLFASPHQLTAPVSAELLVCEGMGAADENDGADTDSARACLLSLFAVIPAEHCRFEVRKRYWHDLTVSASQKLTVFSRGERRFASCTLEETARGVLRQC